MKAIETRYAGCRFRSRLEARWAVFFDALGIPWEYEPQGFECSWRLGDLLFESCEEHRQTDEPCFCISPIECQPIHYLPDFWLPGEQVWVEVKGSLTSDETVRLLNVAAHLSTNGGGGCGYDNVGAYDLVMFGPIPRPDHATSPVRLHMHKGDLEASPWGVAQMGVHYHSEPIASDAPAWLSGWSWRSVRTLLLNGWTDRSHVFGDLYEVARSARFEHGESG